MNFTERLQFALDQAQLTFERRDNFISDSDILDISEQWTTSVRDGNAEYGWADPTDYDAMVDALYAVVFAEENYQ